MASIFPSGIDTFTNPVYTKINGEDVVSAAHINDLQDAVRAVQEVVAGAGKILDMTSNNFIADDTSFKTMLEALDDALGAIYSDFAEHKALVLATDPSQHHANVIAVTAIGNLASTRVQAALQEHQADIDAIMSGGNVEGVTLDDRYVRKATAQTMQGPLTITLGLNVNGNTVLGDNPGDTVTVSGNLNVGGDINLTGDALVGADLLLSAGQKIAEVGETNASYILFGADKLEFYSHKDFIFRLDADDATDGNSDAGQFIIKNGLDATVLTIDEAGAVVAAGSIEGLSGNFVNGITVGALDELELGEDTLEVNSTKVHIQIDKNNLSTSGRFVVTMDGDTANNLASPDLLLNVDETSTLVTGIHKLKSGVQETGYFGLRVMSNNAGGVFFGAGVNFKHQLTNSPSSITLTPNPGSLNYSNLSVVHMDEFGFFFEFDTPAIGASKVFGHYTTVGN